MRGIARGFVIGLSVWLASHAVAAAQGVPPAVSERIDVRLVEVELWATAKGRPVLDLLQSELQLFEDGEPVDIGFFTPPATDGGRAAITVEEGAEETPLEAAHAAEKGTVAIFLDDVHLLPEHRARVVDELVDWLEKRFDERTALTVVRFAGSLEVVAPRNASRAAAVSALRGIASGGSRAVQEELEMRRTLDEIRERQRRGVEALEKITQQFDVEGGNRLGGAAREFPATDLPCSTEMLRMADDLANQIERTARDSIAALGSYSSSLSAAPGRKLLLYVSDGIQLRPGGPAFDLVRTLCDGSGAAQGVSDALDISAQPIGMRNRQGQLDRSSLAMAGESRQLANPFAAVAAQANADGITIWSLGAAGLTTAGVDAGVRTRGRTGGDELRQRADLEAGLSALAADTGGRALLELGDFADGLDDLTADLRSSYLLAFVAPRAADGKLHQIRVETTRPGVRLRHRKLWRDASGEHELGELVGAALLHGIDRPGLGARADVARMPSDGGAARTFLRVVVPESALSLIAGEGGARHGVLRLAIAVREPDGTPSIRSRTFPVERPPRAAGASPQAVVHDIELPPLAAGASVVVGLRDEVDGDVGVLRVEVKDS